MEKGVSKPQTPDLPPSLLASANSCRVFPVGCDAFFTDMAARQFRSEGLTRGLGQGIGVQSQCE